MRIRTLTLLILTAAPLIAGEKFEAKSNEAAFEKFNPVKAPIGGGMVLRAGDRLAICGDSITEQKMYSRIMEDYVTMCVPELGVTVRQFGWSGETARGFLGRMTNDCLRFRPTVATTCYGMNDHEYRPFEERIGQSYRSNSLAVIEAFRANRVRVVLGSPGCVGKMPAWVKSASGTVEDLNLNLCALRNIDVDIAEKERVRFADIFWPMFTAGVEARKEYGADFAIAGKDGVHPGWAGQTLMAYAFLKAFGLRGEIGGYVVDLAKQKMRTSAGHEILSAANGRFEIRSSRYPFCPCLKEGEAAAPYPICGQDDASKDDSIRSAFALIPFNQDLNRLTLVGRNATAAAYVISWGDQRKTFTAEALSRGINLAAEFPCNPFCPAFAKVDAAVAAKQAFETRQIKEAFRSPEAKANLEAVVTRTEQERQPLADAIKTAFVPVVHTLTISPQ